MKPRLGAVSWLCCSVSLAAAAQTAPDAPVQGPALVPSGSEAAAVVAPCEDPPPKVDRAVYGAEGALIGGLAGAGAGAMVGLGVPCQRGGLVDLCSLVPVGYGIAGIGVGLGAGSVVGVARAAALNGENPIGAIAGGLLGMETAIGMLWLLFQASADAVPALILTALSPLLPYGGALLYSGPLIPEEQFRVVGRQPPSLQSKAWIPAVGAGALAGAGGFFLYRSESAHRELARGTTYLGPARGQELAAQGARDQVIGTIGMALAGTALTASVYMLLFSPPWQSAP